MAKRRATRNWYSFKRIMSHNSAYYVVFGERKNGKTFGAKKEVIIEEILNGRQFMYVRRKHRMITKRKMKKLFEDMVDYCVEKLGSAIFYSGQGEFYILRENEKIVVGYCTSIEEAYEDKGIPYNNVSVILFDEFLDYSYFQNEIEMFRHTIANVVRDEERQNVKVIMLGNTVNKYCPYFDFFGINVNKMRQGDIAVVRAKNGGEAVFEYTKTRVSADDKAMKKHSRYFGFDGVGSDMILYGEWEYNDCNTKSVDGFTWNSRRRRINAYITGLTNVYEMSYIGGTNPIAFIRKINTQNGIVSPSIKYNLCFDNSIELLTHKGAIIPKYTHKSCYINGTILHELELIENCIKCGRTVYQNEQTCTEFKTAFDGFMK